MRTNAYTFPIQILWAIDSCTDFCRAILVGILLRNVDEWNTSFTSQNSENRVGPRSKAIPLPPRSPTHRLHAFLAAPLVRRSPVPYLLHIPGALCPGIFYFENNSSRTSANAHMSISTWYCERSSKVDDHATLTRTPMTRMSRLESAIMSDVSQMLLTQSSA
jgi:hypothetical protein